MTIIVVMIAAGIAHGVPVAAAAVTRYAIALENGTSIRSGPGTAYSRLTTVKSGTSLRIMAEAKDSAGRIWYKVDCAALKLKQTVGYVASWVTTVQQKEVPDVIPQDYGISYLLSLWRAKTAVSTQILKPVNMRAGPSITEDRLGAVPVGTVVRLVGYAVNNKQEAWCKITTKNGVSGWVVAASLMQYEPIPGIFMTATVGKRVMSVDVPVSVCDVPFGPAYASSVSLKGRVISGIATDGTKIFAEIVDGMSGMWVDLSSHITIGGTAPGGDVCSMTGIEVIGSCGRTEVTLHVNGDKNGLVVAREHNPERIEVSLPRLIQSAQTTIAGTPTMQLSAVKVWSTSAGFVSKIVLYLTGTGMHATHTVSRSSIKITVANPESTLAKSVFLGKRLLCSCDETLFIDDATFIPLVNVADAYSISLLWDAINRQTSFTLGNRQYVLKDGLKTLKVAQESSRWNEDMVLAPRLIGGSLYVPVATIAHVFNLSVSADVLRIYLNPL